MKMTGVAGRFLAGVLALALVASSSTTIAADEATWTRYLDAGTAAYKNRDPDSAARQFESALQEAEGFGEQDVRLATTLAWLAELYRVQRRFDESEKLIRRTIAIDEKYRGMDHPDLAMSLESLALLYHTQNRQREMEPVLRRAISIYEKSMGPQHLRVASSLNNLAALYRSLGRLDEAEPLVSRALAIREKSLGMDHPDTVQSRNYLSLLHRDLARSRPSRQRQVDLVRQPTPPALEQPAPVAAPAPAPAPAAPLPAPVAQPRPIEPVAPPVQAALPAQPAPQPKPAAQPIVPPQAALPPPAPAKPVAVPPPVVAAPIAPAPIAPAPVPAKPVAAAPPVVVAPPAPPVVAPQVVVQPVAPKPAPLGPAVVRSGAATQPAIAPQAALEVPKPAPAQPAPAKPAVVPAQAALDPRATPSASVSVAPPRRLYRSGLAMQMGFLGAASQRNSPAVVAEAFDLMQLARNRHETGAVSRISARLARADSGLTQVASAREDLLDRWHGLDKTLLEVAARSQMQRGPEESRLRAEIAGIDRQIAQQDALFEQRMPGYRDHLSPESLPLASAQSLLAADEALLSYMVDDNASYLVVVRHDRHALYNLDIGRNELASVVKRLREQLDYPTGDDAGRTVLRTYPVAQANQLYRRILGVAEPALLGAAHLMIVPDDTLNGLPFAALVTEPYVAPIKDVEEHSKVAWFGRRYAISVLPAEGTLRTLRRAARKPAASKPFAGFGDPVLGGEERGVRSGSSSRTYSRDALANVNQIWSFAPLPETRYALYAMADILQADQGDVHLQERASESSVKRLDLSDYRVIAFATHGFMADDFKGLAESALVFTPPQRGTEQDDGLLTASEVAQLKLNAELVILTATSTAAADGTPDSEGVLGLARAFFHAGDRAVMATHWAVPSDATLKLVTRTLRERARGVGNAEALRRAMLPLMNGEDRLAFAHPSYWAPFMVVGEGRTPGAAPPPAIAQPSPQQESRPDAPESGAQGGGFNRLLQGIFGR